MTAELRSDTKDIWIVTNELREAVRRYWDNSDATQEWYDKSTSEADTIQIQSWLDGDNFPDAAMVKFFGELKGVDEDDEDDEDPAETCYVCGKPFDDDEDIHAGLEDRTAHERYHADCCPYCTNPGGVSVAGLEDVDDDAGLEDVGEEDFSE